MHTARELSNAMHLVRLSMRNTFELSLQFHAIHVPYPTINGASITCGPYVSGLLRTHLPIQERDGVFGKLSALGLADKDGCAQVGSS